ncbi:Arabinosyl transferase C [Mycolicibacterium thermoresistibile]|uniref:Arabinosyl transferase C n=1 Tax=Mycolicibacterium thermoresistibile TaxID=1797 RepID=A0A124E7Y1_MYCTH|nr:Arabinosyl transferase C [Mycolicibacterium thermoresistibile]
MASDFCNVLGSSLFLALPLLVVFGIVSSLRLDNHKGRSKRATRTPGRQTRAADRGAPGSPTGRIPLTLA